jgi:hypothetical protein
MIIVDSRACARDATVNLNRQRTGSLAVTR